MALSDVQPPQFLFYKEGDFFKLHQDNTPNPEDTDIFQRKVSTVIFLNPETKGPEEESLWRWSPHILWFN